MANVLGCGTYSAEIRYRPRDFVPQGPPNPPIASLLLARIPFDAVSALSWERRLDDTSGASIVFHRDAVGTVCCSEILRSLPYTHELWIYRDGAMVWQGPIVLKTYKTGSGMVTLEAKDMSAWLDVRSAETDHQFDNVDLSDILLWTIGAAMGKDSPGFFWDIFPYPLGILGSAKVVARVNPVGKILRDLAKTAMTFTCHGRELFIRDGTPYNVNAPLRLADTDIAGELEIITSGPDTATVVNVVSNDGFYSTGPPWEALGATCGWVERFIKIDYGNPQTVALNEMFRGWPPPLIVHVPDNAQLQATAPVTVDQLMCGALINLWVSDPCGPLERQMQLLRLTGTYTQKNERIGVSLVPYLPDTIPAT